MFIFPGDDELIRKMGLENATWYPLSLPLRGSHQERHFHLGFTNALNHLSANINILTVRNTKSLAGKVTMYWIEQIRRLDTPQPFVEWLTAGIFEYPEAKHIQKIETEPS